MTARRSSRSTDSQPTHGGLAWTLLVALVVLPPLLVVPGLRQPFRLPKLIACELLSLAALGALSLRLWRLDVVDLRASARSLPVRAVAPLVAVSVLSALFSAHGLYAVDTLWSFGIAMLLLVGLAWSDQPLRRLLDWTALPASALAVIGILQRFGVVDWFSGLYAEGRYRATALAGNVGDFGAYLVVPILLAQAHLISSLERRSANARRERLLWAAGLLLWGAAVLASQTLSAVAALLVASGLLWLLGLSPEKLRRFWPLAIPLGVVLVVATPLGGRLRTELQELRHGGMNELLTGRLDGWRAGLYVAEHHPIVGAGPGSYSAEFVPAKLALLERGVEFYGRAGPLSHFQNAHNEPIEILAELGGLGLIASLWLVWCCLRGALARPERHERALGLALVAGLAVLSMTYFPLRTAQVAYPWVIAAAWLLAPIGGAATEAESATAAGGTTKAGRAGAARASSRPKKSRRKR